MEPGDDPEGLAEVAQQISMPVAGGESGYGLYFFNKMLDSRSVKIVMPDTKFCGGVGEAYRIGCKAIHFGGQVSLHSPSGPISQLASAHVTAAVAGSMPLEHAVKELIP